MAGDKLSEPVAAWAPLIRALVAKGVSVPLVVLAFTHYRIGPVAWGSAVDSVAAALDLSAEEVGHQVCATCTDISKVDAVAEQLLDLHQALDAVAGLKRGTGLVPTAAKLLHEWRAYAVHRGWPVASLPASKPWKDFLALVQQTGVGMFELQWVAMKYRIRLSDGSTLEPLGNDAAAATVCELLSLTAADFRRREFALLEGGPERVMAALKRLPEKLKTLALVVGIEKVETKGFGRDRYVAAPGVKQLPPPWTRFPEPIRSMRWRMGPGEDCLDEWWAYWRTLSTVSRVAYFEQHVPPAEWREWAEVQLSPEPTEE